MLLDICSLQGRLRNYRYVLGSSAVENDLVGSNNVTYATGVGYRYLQSIYILLGIKSKFFFNINMFWAGCMFYFSN